MSALDNARIRHTRLRHWLNTNPDLATSHEIADERALRDLIAEHERLTAPPTDDEREALALVLGRFGHLTVHVDTLEARRQNHKMLLVRADAVLASPVWRNRHHAPITDAEVEAAWRTYEGVPGDTSVMGPWIGKARKSMRAALEAAREVQS